MAVPDLTAMTEPGQGCRPIENGQGEQYEIELDLRRSRWITGVELLPAQPRSVRRITAYLEPPSREQQLTLVARDSGEIRSRQVPQGRRFLVQWLPGDRPTLFPETAGLFVPAGSRIVVDVLLRPGGSRSCVMSQLRFGFILDHPRQEIDLWLEGREVIGKRRENRQRMAPAELEGELKLDEEVRLIALYPQISGDLSSYEVALEYADRRRRTLLLVPDYRPELDSSYPLAEPLTVPAGTVVSIRGRAADPGGSSHVPARLGLHLQYVLSGHLIAEAPDLPADLLAELGYGQEVDRMGAPASVTSRSRTVVPPAPQFFRADNGYHVIAGSIPAPGVFELRVGDPDGQLLDPRNFSGELVFEYLDELSKTFVQSRARLRLREQSLWARVPRQLPVTFHVVLSLAGEAKRLDFEFQEPRSGPMVRRADFRPVVLPPPLEIGHGDANTRGSLLDMLRRGQGELESAVVGDSGEAVSRVAHEIWRIGMAASQAVTGLGPDERARLQLISGELARAALSVHRVAEEEDSYRLVSARERLDRAVAAAEAVLAGP